MFEGLTVVIGLFFYLLVQVYSLSLGLQKSVIVHYDFENVTDDKVLDATGHGNDAVIVQDVKLAKNHSRCGQALNFTSGFLNVTLRDEWRDLNRSSNTDFGVTIAVWVWLQEEKFTDRRPIFTSFRNTSSQDSDENRLYLFGIRKNGGGVFWVMTKKSKRSEKEGKIKKKNYFRTPMRNSSLAKKGKWIHLAVTFPLARWNNRSASDTNCVTKKAQSSGKVFVNGRVRNRTKLGNKIKCNDLMPHQLGWIPVIGGSPADKKKGTNEKIRLNYRFVGLLDDFYIFNRALGENEILEVMNNSCESGRTAEVTATQTASTKETTPIIKASATSIPSTDQISRTTMVPTMIAPTKVSTSITYRSNSTAIFLTNESSSTTIICTTIVPTKVSTSITKVSTTADPANDGMTSKCEACRITNISEGKTFLKKFINKITLPGNTSTRSNGQEAMKMTKLLESDALILAHNLLKENGSLHLDSEGAYLEIRMPTSGFTFPSAKHGHGITETLTFPDSIFQSGENVSRAVVCISFKNLHMILPQKTIVSFSVLEPNSTVQLSSKIIGAAVDPPLMKSLEKPIEITFNHEAVREGMQICSFWNHTARNIDGTLGQWSTDGCQKNSTKSSPTRTVCECNHLTNFALLLQRSGVPPAAPHLSLRIITYLGCSLSILSCFLCCVMFFAINKKDIRHYLHINLSIALAVAQIILIGGLDRTEYKALCKAMAISLHYFYLVAFLLMLSEGVHLAILLETAFKYGDLKLPIYLITSWGLPVLIVGVTLAARYDSYGGEYACFVTAKEGTAYAFVGPFCLILVINTVILIVVLRHVAKKTSLPISSKAASRVAIARATVRSLVILFPVMGFTWIFGILFFGFQTHVLEYLFGIFCSLQGFFIFLFQYVLNTENRTAFVRAVWRWRSSSISRFSRSESGRASTRQPSQALPAGHAQKLDTLPDSKEKCHLLVYRTIEDKGSITAGGTISTSV